MMKVAVTGTFDGVHSGHRFLLSTLRREACGRTLESLVLTFSDHPLALIAPERKPPMLMSVSERARLIQAEGAGVEVLDFDESLRRLTAAEFLAMLHDRFEVAVFLLGFNNTIGSDRLGAAELAGRTIGGVEVLAAGEHPDFTVSSSEIRMALGRGDIAAANRMLGRPYALEGRVVTGRQLGRTLGFPTANIDADPCMALPAIGVYAGRMLGCKAVVNIGRRPTVEGRDDAPLSVEAHLLDYSGDLYGRHVRLEFFGRLRGEQRFGSLDELKAAIAGDIKAAVDFDYGE